MRPGNRYAKPRPKSLRDVAAAKAALAVTCRRCRHQSMLMPAGLAARLGADFPIEKLAARLRCTNCQGRGLARVDISGRR